jgi:hypothetical protein
MTDLNLDLSGVKALLGRLSLAIPFPNPGPFLVPPPIGNPPGPLESPTDEPYKPPPTTPELPHAAAPVWTSTTESRAVITARTIRGKRAE